MADDGHGWRKMAICGLGGEGPQKPSVLIDIVLVTSIAYSGLVIGFTIVGSSIAAIPE